MKGHDKTREQLVGELEELRRQVTELKASRWNTASGGGPWVPDGSPWYSLLANTPMVAVILDEKHLIRFANHTDSGASLNEVLGRSLYDFCLPEDRERIRRCVQQVFQTGKPNVYETSVVRLDDQQHWYISHLGPIFEGGTVIGVSLISSNVTEQKRAEAALAEREARLLEAQEVASLGFYVLDIATGHFTTSSILDRLFGIPAQYDRTVAGWGNLIHPDERQAVLDHLLEVTQERKRFDCEYRIIRQGDKEERWLHGLGRLRFNEAGQPVSMLGTVQDITDRKRAEESLRASEERYRLFMESAPQTVWRTDLEGNVLDCNRHWSNYTGQTPEEAQGSGWSKAVHPDDLARVAEQVRDDLLRGEAYQCEQRLRRASDGSYRWHLARGVPVKDDKGKVTGWIGSTTDIHDQKSAEEALRQSECTLRTLMDANPESILLLDRAGTILLANETFVQRLGKSVDETAGRTLYDLLPPEVATNRKKRLEEVVRTGKPIRFEDKRFDRDIENAIHPILDTHGHVVALVVLGIDQTDRKRAEAALKQAHAPPRSRNRCGRAPNRKRGISSQAYCRLS